MAKILSLFKKKPGKAKEKPALTGDAKSDLKARLDGIVARAKRQRLDWIEIYQDGIDYVFGNQLANVPVKDGHSRIQDNQIFPAVTQEQSLINQNRVIVKALPFEKSDEGGAKVWEPILFWQYEQNLKIPRRILSGIIDAKTHGHWVGRTLWNPRDSWDRNENRWIGEVNFKLCRPDTIEFAPDTEDADKTEWVVEFDRMRLSAAQTEWPDMAERLELEGVDDAEYRNDGITSGFGNTYIGQPDGGPTVNADGRPSVEGRLADLIKNDTDEDEEVDKYVLVERHFFKDRETRRQTLKGHRFTPQELLDGGVAIEGPDPENEESTVLIHAKTGEPITEESWPSPDERVEDVPLYPTYRSVCRCGDIILHDKAWDLDDHPYSLGVNLLLPHNWHGLNGVEMPRAMQDVINRTAMAMEAWVRFAGLPIVTVEEGAIPACPDLNGVAAHVVVKPGAVWKVAPNRSGGVKFLNIEVMPQTVPAVRGIFMESLRDQTGVQEIGLGKEVGGTATEAIRLETNTKLRTALQWKLVEIWILRVMSRTQAICQKNYSAGEKRRIAGPNLDAQIAQLDQTAFNARFDLRLEVATSLPFDRERRKREAMELYGILGVPFLEQLLDAYERDDKADVLQKNAAYQMIVEMLNKQKAATEQQAGAIGAAPQTGESANAQAIPQEKPAGTIAGYGAGAGQGAGY